MKTFTSKEVKNNKQSAASYVVYMIVGSYFKDCICKNVFEEKRMYLNYAELSAPKQIEMEDKMICQMEKLDKSFLKAIEDMKCKVSFIKQGEEMIVKFETGGFGALEYKVNVKGQMDCLTFLKEEKSKGENGQKGIREICDMVWKIGMIKEGNRFVGIL